MDDLKMSQESMGAAAAGVKQQISETAADAKQKVTDLAESATDKVKAASDYLRQTQLTAMAEDVKEIVKRYPGWSLAAAAVVGGLLAQLGSRD
jgi:ElaB/YqjD/DUF883 family membrane-anchored ribosome-binding protein